MSDICTKHYVFKYLRYHKHYKCVFDLNYLDITNNHIPVKERAIYRVKFMNELYPGALKDLPPNAPKPKGCSIQISCFVDADHGGDQINRRSRTRILIFLNKYPSMC